MSTDEGDRPPERSQCFFEHWRVCDHRAVETLVVRAVNEGEAMIAASRIRKRRDQDRESFSALARALVVNAAYALALGLEPPTVAIPLAKPRKVRTRYDGPGFGQLASVLATLAPHLVTIRKSRREGIVSTLEPGDSLRDCIAGLNDFGVASFRQTGGETIIVRRIERDYAMGTREGVTIDYQDNAETIRFRRELERINSALESAQLGFDDPAGLPINVRERRLRRNFNTPDERPRFDLGGRLSGGWWANLERTRRQFIRIEGETVADLDFSTMFLRLAYIRAGLTPPDGDDDLYAGILQGGADESHWRPGLKVVANAMLSRTTPLQRLPKGSAGLLPKGCKASPLREAILKRHGPIRDQFEAGIGGSLARLESDILITILLRLLDLGIVALPMHDGIMVRRGAAGPAASVMRDVSKALTGHELPVKEKPLVATN